MTCPRPQWKRPQTTHDASPRIHLPALLVPTAAREPGYMSHPMSDGPASSQDPHSLRPQQGILHLVYTKQKGRAAKSRGEISATGWTLGIQGVDEWPVRAAMYPHLPGAYGWQESRQVSTEPQVQYPLRAFPAHRECSTSIRQGCA